MGLKEEITKWQSDGPFTIAEVKRLARQAHRHHEDIGYQIAAGLYNFSSKELDALHTEFDKHPGRFEGAYWVFETKDLLKMNDDQLVVLSRHVNDSSDAFSELRDTFLTSSPGIALKFFRLLREADELEKESKSRESKAAVKKSVSKEFVIGNCYTMDFQETDVESQMVFTNMVNRYRDQWLLTGRDEDGRYIFQPTMPKSNPTFLYRTPDPSSQFK
jgi:hypothetical protein